MENLLSFLIKDYAAKNGITGPCEFARRYGFKRSTAGYWWRGENVPGRKSDRERLSQLIRHTIFEGELTKEKKQLALAPMTSIHQEGASLDQVIERFAHLGSAILPDLRILINASAETRRLAKQALGDEKFIALYTYIRAISSDATFQSLSAEGMLDKLKGGGEIASRS